MAELSIVIPARREEWLGQTVQDVLAHTSDRTEIIVVLDGEWPTTPLSQHERVQVIYLPESIGQRAATNLAARVSTAKWICKLDAHCGVAPGFDVALLEAAQTLGRECVQVPAQFNLHVYNQVCPTCEPRFCVDQAPHLPNCPRCHGPLTKEIVWQPRKRPKTTGWHFNSELQFQYGCPKQGGEFPETMSLLGACWFQTRESFLARGGLDEGHGSWGQVGVEVACKAWLSGGRVVTNTRTWFAHFFRVGGIGFPYEMHGSDQEKARVYSRNLWRSNGWSGQVKPLRWLVEKFAPAGWTKEQIEALPERIGNRAASDPTELSPRQLQPVSGVSTPNRTGQGSLPRTKGIVYYSDCCPEKDILDACRRTIEASGLPIVAVTLKPIDWPAAKNIVLDAERGVLTMFRQILAGLEACDADYVFLAEHDLLYHHSHWDFVPPRDDTYYYQMNVVKVDAETGRAISYDTKQTSGLCANRELLVRHYRERVRRVELDGFSRRMGFEPGSHQRAERVDDVPSDVWRSPFPNIDIRHGKNLTASRWSPEQFRDRKNCQNWREYDVIPGWGKATELPFVRQAVQA